MQYRIRTLLIITAVVAALGIVFNAVRNFDGPYATVLVSDDKGLELTDDAVILLTESALKKISLQPDRPLPSYGPPESMYAVGRNAQDPDRISIIWKVRGEDRLNYTVRLRRNQRGIVAAIYKNWL